MAYGRRLHPPNLRKAERCRRVEHGEKVIGQGGGRIPARKRRKALRHGMFGVWSTPLRIPERDTMFTAWYRVGQAAGGEGAGEEHAAEEGTHVTTTRPTVNREIPVVI